MTRPHPEIATVDQLLAADPAVVVAIAAYAKSVVRLRRPHGELALSQLEIVAMAWVLDFYLEDHHAVRGARPMPAYPTEQAPTAGTTAGTTEP